MRKILIFSTAYYPLVGGAEVAVKEITDRIDDLIFDMITLQLNKKHPSFEKVGSISVYRIGGGKLFFPIFAFLKARWLHKKNNYDAIWAMMASRAGFGALFFKLTHPKIPYLLTLQEGDKFDYPRQRAGFLWFFVGFLFSKIFTKADFIQAISNYLANWAREMGAKCPIEIVPNGVDMEKFRNPKSEIRNNVKIQISKDDKILITTSRLVEKNAIGDVVEALRYLPENIKFLVLGIGPLEIDLKFKIKNLKLDGRVLMLGYIDHKYLPGYLKIADIFIRPSLSEGMGNSFIEAMAAGIPVIATPVGGIPDFLKDGETGLFCEVRDPKSIAKKAKLLLENNELREKIIKNSKEMVIKNYDWDLIAKNMREKVFGRMVEIR